MQAVRAGMLVAVGAAAGLFVLSGVTHAVHRSLPYSEPDRAIASFFTSVSAGDLEGFRLAVTPEFYRAFVEAFGTAKYARVEQILEGAQRMGARTWWTVYQRSVQAACEGYDNLRQRAESLGREEFLKLSPEQRMALMDGGGDVFLSLGIRALPPDQARSIGDPEAFASGRGRSRFCEANAWAYASAEDRNALGSPSALSQEDTPERRAYTERVGIPGLPATDRAELGAITRAELLDVAAFKFKYGEPLAREFLARKAIPAHLSVSTCGFPRADHRGGLLRGREAACSVRLPRREQEDVDLRVELRKAGSLWSINAVEPALYAVRW